MRRISVLCVLVFVGTAYGQQDVLQLTLGEAEQLALRNNPSITARQLSAEALAQEPAQFKSAFQPALSASFTGVGADGGTRIAAGGLNNPVIYNRLGSGLSLNQMITDFGRTRSLVESAQLRAAAEDQATVATKAQVILQVDRAFFAVLRGQALLKVAEQTVSARQLIADQVSALAESKMKSTLDVSFANLNLADAKLLLAGAQNDVKAALAELATAMGLPGQQSFRLVDDSKPDALPNDLNDLIQQAIAKRPDLADLRLQERAARRFTDAEKALQYPSIGLVATGGFVPAGQVAVPGRYGAVGVNVSVPLFNGGLFTARRTEADLRARAAAQNVKSLENRVARDVRVTYLNAMTAYERLGLTAQLLTQAQSALELAQARYDLGLSSIVELSQAQLNLTSAQIASTSARYDYQAQRSHLAYQIGSLP